MIPRREQRVTSHGIVLTAIRVVGSRVWWHRYDGAVRRRGWVSVAAWNKLKLKESTRNES